MQIPMDKMCKHQQLFDSRDAVVPPLALICMQYQADARTVYEECMCNKMADLMFRGEQVTL